MTTTKGVKPYTEVILAADFLRDVGLMPQSANLAALRLMELGFKRSDLFGFDTGKRVFLYVDAGVAKVRKEEFLTDFAPKNLLDDEDAARP